MNRSFIVKMILLITLLFLVMGIVGCSSDDGSRLAVEETVTARLQPDQKNSNEPRGAFATLVDTNGSVVGKALLSTVPEGVKIKITLAAVDAEPGTHGLHIHEVASCYPDFDTAGGHFNPTGHQHGLNNSQGSHAGDLPNLVLKENGTASYEAITNKVTLTDGEFSLFDSDGSALILHEGPDDLTSDPTGNSGGRIVCGVIVVQLSSLSPPAGS